MNLKDILNEFDNLTSLYNDKFGNLSSDTLNTKINEETWCIAEIFQHIIQVNESYYPIFKKISDNTLEIPFLGKIGFINNMFGNMILKYSQPENKTKTKTQKIWEPIIATQTKTDLQTFANHHDQLKDEIVKIAHFMGKNIIIPSPANKNICYKLDILPEIMIVHEKRHLQQAENIKNLLEKIK